MIYLRNIFLFIFVSMMCVSCSNYRLSGTPQPLPFKSVYVKPVQNYSYAPQAANLLSTQVIDMISQTPGLNVADLNDAQAVLEMTLVDYKLQGSSTRTDNLSGSRRTDTALASAFFVTLEVKCTLKDRVTGEIIFKDRLVKATDNVYVGQSFLLSEYQNMPILTRELARKVVDQVIGIW